jgi:hypothetical protein
MPQAVRASTSEASRRNALLQLSAPSGGWSYYPDRGSRIEPTCWALLALGPVASRAPEAAVAAAARAFLRTLQRPDGLLVEPATPGPNYGWNGLALLALNAQEDLDLVDRLANGLLAVKGIQIEDDGQRAVRVDSRLQAWSWTEGTFSWVEPTAYCLLALKQVEDRTPAIDARITEAEAVLADRVCPAGGWNYGNSAVLGQDLRPYVSTTALGLLAMADRPAEPSVARSLDWLEAHATTERATMALALTALALTIHGRPAAAALADLAALGDETAYLDNAHLIAMALYALTIPDHDARAFRIPATRSALQSEQ